MRASRLSGAPVIALLYAASLSAQWLTHPTSGIPRLADGSPDLNASAPKTPDGRPDLAGLWMPGQPYVVGSGPEPGVIPFKEWAEEVWKWRYDTFGRDDPAAYCIVGGVPRVNLIPYPLRIVTAPDRVVVLYEIFHAWREILTDGRDLPVDPNPTWMGYSVGRWDGDVFTARQASRMTGVSERTIHRYITAMRELDRIDGEAGVGFLYRGPKK